MINRNKRFVSWLVALSLILTMLSTIPLGISAQGDPDRDDLVSLSNRQLAVRVMQEGSILLENDGTLPLSKGVRLALFGTNMDGNFFAGGGGSGGSNTTDVLTYAQAFRNAAKAEEVELFEGLMSFYEGRTAETLPSESLLDQAAEFTDTAVIFIGRWSEEGVDRKAEPGSYYLSNAEKQLIEKVKDRFDRVIVNLNLCGVTDLSFAKEDGISAVLLSWMPGQYGAQALPDILLGKANPSGKLPDTFADDYSSYASACSFGESIVEYEEDIFVGYRYFETIPGADRHVLYPFGYGLSYTTFSVTDVTVTADPDRDTALVTARVTNTGNVPGKEVIQVYYGHPEVTLLEYPAKELIGFFKTAELAPGESETVEIRFSVSDMAAYDDTGLIREFAYVLEDGEYPIYVGTDVRSAGKAGSVSIPKTVVTKQCTSAGAETMQLTRRLLADGSYEEPEQRLPEDEGGDVPGTRVSADGATILQCENFTRLEGNTQYSVQNGSLHNMNHGGTLYYDLDVEEEDDYQVLVRTAQGSLTGKNCLTIYVEGEKQSEFRLDMDDLTGGWEVYQYFDCGYIHLEEGPQELEVRVTNGACGNLDLFRLIPLSADSSGETFDTAGIDSRYVIRSEGTTELLAKDFKSKSNPAFSVSSAGFVENLHLGGSLVYEWYAQESADYLVTVSLAAGDSGADSAASVLVNGTVQANFSLSTSGGTGSWTEKKDFPAGMITLQAGKNTVELIPSCGFNPYSFRFERIPGAPAIPFRDIDPVSSDRLISFRDVAKDPSRMEAFVQQLTNSELMSLVHGGGSVSTWADLSRYDVPRGTVSDGPAGLRSGTYWPVSVTQASTWNPNLLAEIGLRTGREAYALGVDIWLAPAMNIHRNPLCGRNFEYYSEDPLLAGVCAGNVVLGTQAQGVSVALKHLAANNCEASRNSSDSRMSERALREIYLEGFRLAICIGNPWAIMTSYNRINGREVSESRSILQTIVREEFGYTGLIMSDWWNDSREDRELNAGNDLKMPEGNPGELVSAFAAGTLTRQTLQASATRVLELVLKIDRLHQQLDSSFVHTEATVVVRPSPAEDPDSVEYETGSRPEPGDKETGSATEEGTGPVPKKGCGSVLCGGLILSLLGTLVASPILFRKGRDRRL